MRLTVDRVSDGIVVLEREDMSRLEVAVELLPDGTKEGSVLDFDGNVYVLNPDAEAEARARIIQKQRNIFKKH